MRVLSITAAVNLLLEKSSIAVAQNRILELRFAGSAPSPFRLEVPADSGRAISLAYVVLMSDVPTDDEPDFAGGSLWLQDWNIWGEASDRVGCTLLEALRLHDPSGRPTRINETPVLSMGAGEIAFAHTALTLALIFQWDAYYVPASKRFMAFVSHDGYVQIQSSTPGVQGRLFERFTRGGWSPAPEGNE